MDLRSVINKVKGVAGKNPEKVRESVDKVESIVNEKTGGKYADQVSKGGDAVEHNLGIPDEGKDKDKDTAANDKGADENAGSGSEQSPSDESAESVDKSQEPAAEESVPHNDAPAETTDATSEQPGGDQPQGQQPSTPQS